MTNTKKRLSLGCGKRKKTDYIGLDCVDYGWNTVWKANEKIPFEDNNFDVIEAYNFFEHLYWEEAQNTLNECWRVLKTVGELDIVVPKAGTINDFSDPTHKSHWTEKTFKSYIPTWRPKNADYGLKPWDLKFVKMHPNMEDTIWAILKPRK